MQLGVAAPSANVVFEQPAGGVESVADRDIDILMRVVRCGIASDDDLAPSNFEVDTDAEQIALATARVAALDDDAAGHNPIKKAFELLGALTYSCGDHVGRFHMTKCDLQW